MKKAFLTIFAATIMVSCNQTPRQNNVNKAQQQESAAVSEYRDSGKWGKAVSRDFECGEFDAFEAEGNIEVVYRQADAFAVKTVGHEEALDLYDINIIEQDDMKKLHVAVNEDASEEYDNIPAITLLIASPSIKSIYVEGGDVEMKGTIIQNEDLNIVIQGEGDVYAKNLECGAMNIEVHGDGDVTFKKAKANGDVNIEMNDDGDMEGKLKCKGNMHIVVNGVGKVDIETTCQELTAECNGTGDIELEGSCTVLYKRDGINGAIDSRKLAAEKVILMKK